MGFGLPGSFRCLLSPATLGGHAFLFLAGQGQACSRLQVVEAVRQQILEDYDASFHVGLWVGSRPLLPHSLHSGADQERVSEAPREAPPEGPAIAGDRWMPWREASRDDHVSLKGRGATSAPLLAESCGLPEGRFVRGGFRTDESPHSGVHRSVVNLGLHHP